MGVRTIKFRARHGNEWVYGDIRLLSKIPHIYTDEFTAKSINVESVGQYTGIKDVNGIEVYEGDVLHMREFDNRFLPLFGKDADPLDFTLDECKGSRRDAYVTCIRFADGEFVFSDGRGCDTSLSVLWGDMRLSSPLFEFEVIGNVYEHPEYLTKGVKC